MKTTKMLTYICLALIAVPIAASEPQTKEVGRLSQAYKTFKNDMRCLLSRTKKCTPEQRKRIRNNAFKLVGVLVAATGVWAGVSWFRSWREQKGKTPGDEDIIIFDDDDESDEELSPTRERRKGGLVTTLATEVRTKQPEKKLTDEEAFKRLFEIALEANEENITEAMKTEASQLISGHRNIINLKGQYGWTPLHATASVGNVKIAKLLIDGGADRTIQSHGSTPYDIAKLYRSKYGDKKFIEIIAPLLELESVQSTPEAEIPPKTGDNP